MKLHEIEITQNVLPLICRGLEVNIYCYLISVLRDFKWGLDLLEKERSVCF